MDYKNYYRTSTTEVEEFKKENKDLFDHKNSDGTKRGKLIIALAKQRILLSSTLIFWF